LGDSTCYQSLTRLVQKASPKSQDGKRTMEEMLEKMRKLHESQSVDMAAYDKANQKRGSKVRVNEKAVGDILEQAQERMNAALAAAADENKEESNSKKAGKGKGKMGAATKKKVAIREDDEEVEEEEENVKKGRKATAKRKTESDEEEEQEIIPENKSCRVRARKVGTKDDD
jgi:hypothetical protein